MSCHFGVRHFTFSPSGNICQSWSIVADIGLIGRQSIIDWLATSIDCWGVLIIILQEVEVKSCKQKILRGVVGDNLICTSFSPDW